MTKKFCLFKRINFFKLAKVCFGIQYNKNIKLSKHDIIMILELTFFPERICEANNKFTTLKLGITIETNYYKIITIFLKKCDQIFFTS